MDYNSNNIEIFINFTKKLEMYIQRTIHEEIQKHLTRKEYTIITGPRQSGKTSLLNELFRRVRNEGYSVTFITLEDRDIRPFSSKYLEMSFLLVKRKAILL